MRNPILPLATGFAILALNVTVAYSCNKDTIIGSIKNESMRTNRNPVTPKKAMKLLIKKQIDIKNCNFEFVLDTIFRPYWIKNGSVNKYRYYFESSKIGICISYSFFIPAFKPSAGNRIISEQTGEKYSYCKKI